LSATNFFADGSQESPSNTMKSGRCPLAEGVGGKLGRVSCAILGHLPFLFLPSLLFRPRQAASSYPAGNGSAQNLREHPPRQMALSQQEPVVPARFTNRRPSLTDEPLLQAG